MEPRQLIAALATTSGVTVALALLTRVSVGADRRNMRALACRGAALASGLAAGALAFSAPAWSACAVLALLLAALAVTIAFATPRPLLDHSRAATQDGEPAWWPQFEHDFRAYARGPQHKQNPLQAAVTKRTPPASSSPSVMRMEVPR